MADEQAIATAAAQDIAQKASMPALVPEGFEDIKFLVPDLPMEPFMLVKEDGEELGPFVQSEFITEPNGITVAHDTTTGEPIILRVILQFSKRFRCVDENGNEYELHAKDLPGENLEIEDPS